MDEQRGRAAVEFNTAPYQPWTCASNKARYQNARPGFMQYSWSGMEILATSVAVHIRAAFVTAAANTVLASKHFSTRNPPYVQIVSNATIQGIYVARGRCEHFLYNTNSSCRLRISTFIIGSASRNNPILRTLGCCPCGSLQSYLSKI